MALFKRKTPDYVDLGETIRKKEERLASFRQNNAVVKVTEPEQEINPQTSVASGNGFFGGLFGGSAPATPSEPEVEQPNVGEDRKKKITDVLRILSKRTKDQEREIESLKQRLEVLERKQRIGY